MARLLPLLLLLVFVAGNGLAAPFALCRHADVTAHAAARTSEQLIISLAAHGEEAAESAGEKQGTLADAAASALAGALLPDEPALSGISARGAMRIRMIAAEALFSRVIGPLLEPPLG
ncbi:hypothetical protein [Allosphingosinicella deserti]|uniref:Uncharacterized protein n=1 Tax=Allosphingosinicella deserti TaxID=2116704 RepID=A0A2P7QYH1_9SPHN|nr:hypothetical protein [Sphingomonas deserti]PSJ43022.1 hypothetical protein C7I55_01040 [Sphingomonas deserti]